MKCFLLIVIALLLVPAWCHAEENQGKVEITIYSGLSFLDVNERIETPCAFCLSPIPLVFVSERSIDGSFLFGVKAGYYLNHKMEVEGSFAIGPNHDLTEVNDVFCRPGEICPLSPVISALIPAFLNQSNVVSYQYDANFVYNIIDGDVRPFVSFGAGGVTSSLPLQSETDFAFNFGGGAKFYFKNVGIRAELNDHVIADYFLTGKTEHDLQVQYGFVFRLP